MREQYFRLRKWRYIKPFLLVQFLDLVTTWVGIGLFGFREVNPIMKNLTLVQMSMAKVLAVLLMFCILWYPKRFPVWAYKMAILISLPPVLLNAFQIILCLVYV